MVRKASTQGSKKPGNRKGLPVPKKPTRYTKEEVIAALKEKGGFIYATAAHLDLSPETMKNYMKRWPELRKVVKQCKRHALDRAERKLIDLIDRGDFRAIKYFLSCQGKKRGYGTQKVKIETNNVGLPIGVSEEAPQLPDDLKREILNKVRAKCGMPALAKSTPLEIGLKELPDQLPIPIVIDNKPA